MRAEGSQIGVAGKGKLKAANMNKHATQSNTTVYATYTYLPTYT